METMKNMKPMSTKVRDTVLRIVERAIYYNNTPTRRELTGDKPTFDVRFNGCNGKFIYNCFIKGDSYKWNYWETMEQPQSGSIVRLCEDDNWPEDRILRALENITADMEHHYDDWYTRQEAAPNE